MKQLYLFHFTPSQMPITTLEDLLVQREPLLKRVVSRIQESANTQSKHHTLLLGPRGIGKTHLVAMTYHRIRSQESLRDRLRIAWLREDEWGVDSFLNLLERIGRALSEEYPTEFPSKEMELLFDLTPNEAQKKARTILEQFLSGHSLLLLIENLDDIFAGMGDKGQREFRAFLQEGGQTTILATSQSLSPGIARHTGPFYNFFQVERLADLSVEEAAQLLKNIALLKNDQELANFIGTPAGMARVRAINLLASGNPRVYVILSEFLTRQSLEALVEPVLSTLDQLTPYFQARLDSLPIQKQKIVVFLCDHGSPTTVKDIARRCFITSQTASSQLKELKERGYVREAPVNVRGKETYYEIKEPLMRICLDVKKTRTGPVRLLIEFLRYWYPLTELRQQLAQSSLDQPEDRRYIELAITKAEQSDDPRVRACQEDFDRYIVQKDFDKALKVAEELVSVMPDANAYTHLAVALSHLNREEEAAIYFDKAIELEPESAVCHTNKAVNMQYLNCSLEDREKELMCAIEYNSIYARAWSELSIVYQLQNKKKEALLASRKAIKLAPNEGLVWLQRGWVYSAQGNWIQALQCFSKANTFLPDNWDILTQKLTALHFLMRFDEALSVVTEAITLYPDKHYLLRRKLDILWRLNKQQEAIDLLSKHLTLYPDNASDWTRRGEFYALQDQFLQALNDFNQSVDREENGAVYLNRASVKMGLQDWEGAMKDIVKGFEISPFTTYSFINQPAFLIRNILLYFQDTQSWKPYLQMLWNMAVKEGYESNIEASLLYSIPVLLDENISLTRAQYWNDAWQEIGKESNKERDKEYLRRGLRLLAVAVEVKKTRSERPLLALTAEERELLRPYVDSYLDTAEQRE